MQSDQNGIGPEAQFDNDKQEAEDLSGNSCEEDAPRFDIGAPFWTVTAALIWIATLDVKRVAADGAKTHDGANWSFIFDKSQGTCTGREPSACWLELGAELAGGTVRAFANRTIKRRIGGYASTETGLTFPPVDRRGLVLDYVLAVDNASTVVRPAEAPWATAFEEWSEVRLQRDDILRLWPRACTKNEESLDDGDCFAAFREPNPSTQDKDASKKQRRTRTPVRLNKVKQGLLELHSNALPEGTLDRADLISKLKKEKGIVATKSTFDRAVESIRAKGGPASNNCKKPI